MKNYFFNPVALLLLLLTTELHAASSGINSADLLDSILVRFSNTASVWSSKMVAYGTWLFWSLALLSMVWTYGMMAMKKVDIQEFFAETIRFFTVTGFFLWILQNGPVMSIAIINTMRQIASDASGLSKVISPSGIVDIGFDILCKVVDKSSIWSPSSSIVGLLVAGIILVVLALVAINMLLMLISAWLLAYGGIFLLGFGGGRWTQDIAINYYKTVLGIAMQMFTMILIVGIGKSFIDQYYAAMSNDMALKELFVMLVVSIVLLSLINKLPPMIGGIVGGSNSGGGGMGGFGAGAAVGAAAMGAAMAGSAASAALGGAVNVAGGGAAIKAAFQVAQQSMGLDSGGKGMQGNASGGLASAIGAAGRFAAEMGSHLTTGTAQTIKSKVDAIKEAAAERISDTVGGKIATAINNNVPSSSNSADGDGASQVASNDSKLEQIFEGNSLGPGSGSEDGSTASINDEVANFVNRPSANDAGG